MAMYTGPANPGRLEFVRFHRAHRIVLPEIAKLGSGAGLHRLVLHGGTSILLPQRYLEQLADAQPQTLDPEDQPAVAAWLGEFAARPQTVALMDATEAHFMGLVGYEAARSNDSNLTVMGIARILGGQVADTTVKKWVQEKLNRPPNTSRAELRLPTEAFGELYAWQRPDVTAGSAQPPATEPLTPND